MKKATGKTTKDPASDCDPEVFAFRSHFEDARSVLDQLVRQGAQQMLQAAIDVEVSDFIARLQTEPMSRDDGWSFATVI